MSTFRKGQPGRKLSTRYTTKPPAGMPEFEMIPPPGKTNGFVIQVTERPEGRPSTAESARSRPSQESGTIHPPVHAHRTKPQPPPLALAIPPKAHIKQCQKPPLLPGQLPPPPLTPPPSQIQAQNRAPSPADIPLPRSSTNTPDLVRSNSDPKPSSVISPVMRSMFPKYDPSRPLNRQSYYPNIEAVPGLASAMAVAGSSSNNPFRQQMNRRSMTYPRASLDLERNETPDVKDTPLRMVENAEHEASLSKPEELLELWNIANGQAASEEAPAEYYLELSCDDLTFGREIITFNSSTTDPIYTLEASHSNMSISRVHPANHTPVMQICGSVLSQPTAIDPLVTWVFPKLAGLMALDQSSNVAVTHKLDRQASAELQNEAIQRAQEQDASMLLWDDSSNKYCLMHPTLLDNAATTLPITIIPNSSSPQKITIFAPETSEPLLDLSIQTLTLTIHAKAITALPSYYIMDTLMTTLLTLLLHLHRSCATPSVSQTVSAPVTPMFPPPPTLAHMDSRSSLRRKRANSRLSAFRSTKSVKSVKSARSMHSVSAYDQDIELQSLPPMPDSSEEVRVGTKEAPLKPLFSTDDQSLPKTTRAVLKLLYWIFEVIFWFMNVIVQLLAAVVVGAGKMASRL